MPENIEVAVISANLTKGIVWAVPLVQDFRDQVLVPVNSKTNRPFVPLPARITIYIQLHIVEPAHSKTLRGIRQSSPSSYVLPIAALLVRRDVCESRRPYDASEPSSYVSPTSLSRLQRCVYVRSL